MCFLKILNTEILEPCFRISLRDAGDASTDSRCEQPQVRYEAVPKQKLVSAVCSSRKRRLITAKAKNKVDCEFRDISKHVAKILRHGGRHEADGAAPWENVLSLLKDAERTKFGLSTDKPRMENCEDQVGTIRYIRSLQGHSHGAAIHPNMFPLKQIPFGWKANGTNFVLIIVCTQSPQSQGPPSSLCMMSR